MRRPAVSRKACGSAYRQSGSVWPHPADVGRALGVLKTARLAKLLFSTGFCSTLRRDCNHCRIRVNPKWQVSLRCCFISRASTESARCKSTSSSSIAFTFQLAKSRVLWMPHNTLHVFQQRHQTDVSCMACVTCTKVITPSCAYHRPSQ